jgi:hypothetical protein
MEVMMAALKLLMLMHCVDDCVDDCVDVLMTLC